MSSPSSPPLHLADSLASYIELSCSPKMTNISLLSILDLCLSLTLRYNADDPSPSGAASATNALFGRGLEAALSNMRDRIEAELDVRRKFDWLGEEEGRGRRGTA